MAHVTIHRSLEQLESLQLQWRKLLGEMPAATIWQTYDWYRYVVQQSAEPLQPYVLLVESGNRVVGILPLVQSRRETRWGELQVLRTPPATPAAPFRPIGRQATATLIASLRTLQRRSREWDFLEWEGVSRGGGDQVRTSDAFANAHLTLKEHHRARCRQQQVERVAGVISGEHDWQWEQLAPAGARLGDGDPAWSTFRAQLFGRTWSHLHLPLPAMSGIATWREQLESLHEFASHRGCGRLLVARRNDQPVMWRYFLNHAESAVCVAEGIADLPSEVAGSLVAAFDQAALRWLLAEGIQSVEYDEGAITAAQRAGLSEVVCERVTYRAFARSRSVAQKVLGSLRRQAAERETLVRWGFSTS